MAIDDATRLVYAELLPFERRPQFARMQLLGQRLQRPARPTAQRPGRMDIQTGQSFVDTGVVRIVQELALRLSDVRLTDQSRVFNTARIEALELENLMECALATVTSALQRQESRGAHSREDFSERDDDNWLKHSLAYLNGDSVRIDYKNVDTSVWEPKPRTY